MDQALDDIQAAVARVADEAQAVLLRLLADGVPPDEAVRIVQDRFAMAFAETLAAAMSAAPGGNHWDVRAVQAMPVGEISLSRRLYRHTAQTAHEVASLVRSHARGAQQARELALRLYDGYDPADGIRRPLEGSARAELPKALRALTADPATRASLTRLVSFGQAQAARLKTRALRAAYSEALDAWTQGAGQKALQRRLDVAHKEKTRYMADRIAQTELARAHQHALADELMRDPSISVVQVVLSGSHPRADICDMHARADLFGLGPGCYPKAKAPRPTFHPFCRCRLRSRPDLSDAGVRERPDAAREYLRGLPQDEAARVMGSQAALARVLRGADPIAVMNEGQPKAYRLARLGEAENRGMPTPYDIAKAGGTHAGLIRRFGGETRYAIDKSMRSLRRLIAEHEAKIRSPAAFVAAGTSADEVRYLVETKWPKEIAGWHDELVVFEGILKERGDE